MKQLFISYSRKDTEFTRRFTDRFIHEGLDAWVDWQDIPPSVDWMLEIQKGIEDADVFLFLVSPDSISSPICADEVGHAIANGKRIIPIVVRDIDAKSAPAAITHLNWIFFSRPQDDFEHSFAQVWSAIHTDYDWVQTHRRLQVKALEWDRSQREDSLHLRGKDLQDAEAQFLVNGEKSPRPTELQRAFVAKSREVENAQLEKQRAQEQQLELEKRTGSRLRRLSYGLLIVFSLAFALLYLWLFKLVTDLSYASIKNQMIALVETGSVLIDGQKFKKAADVGDTDSYLADLNSLLTTIKHANKSVDPNMSFYALVQGTKPGEILIVASADQEYQFKQAFVLNSLEYSQYAGLEKTTADFTLTKNEFENKISACTPIRDQQSHPVGALCTDFHSDIVYDTRASVARTLAIAFISVYPVLVLVVLWAPRSLAGKKNEKKKTVEA
jgi:hypothetical protein